MPTTRRRSSSPVAEPYTWPRNGANRIYPPTRGRFADVWRVLLAFEDGTKRFRNAATEEAAREIALYGDRPAAPKHRAVPARRTVKALAAAYMVHLAGRADDYDAGLYAQAVTRGYVNGRRSTLNCHILPVLGELVLPEDDDDERPDVWSAEQTREVLRRAARGGAAPASVQRIGEAMRGMVSFAHATKVEGVRWMSRAADPCAGVSYHPGCVDVGVDTCYIDRATLPVAAQVEALATAFVAMGLDTWALAVRLVACSGLRWGELIALRPCDFDFDRRLIRVDSQLVEHENFRRRLPKWKKRRRTFFTEALASEMHRLVTEVRALSGDEAEIFVHPNGRCPRQQWFSETWARAAQLAAWPMQDSQLDDTEYRCRHCQMVVRMVTPTLANPWTHRQRAGDPPSCGRKITDADVDNTNHCRRCGLLVRHRSTGHPAGWRHIPTRNDPLRCRQILTSDDVLSFESASPMWTMHSLRHYAASWMIGTGPGDLHLEPVKVAQFLGHTDWTFTMRQYVQPRGDAEADVFARTALALPVLANTTAVS